MPLICRLAVAGAVLLALAQFIHPVIPTRPASAELNVPSDVKQILEKSCYSCHSDEPRLAWFDQIQPGYWIVRHDILTARAHLNFSTLGVAPPAVQRAKLFEAVNMIQLGAMPLPQFTALHPGARVTAEELITLKAFVAPWGSAPGLSMEPNGNPDIAVGDHVRPTSFSLSAVESDGNGLAFDPSFEKWRLLSTTDRGDNSTFRFILGNEIAMKAAQSGKMISPWRDGAKLAKIAWEQNLGHDGLIHPGRFIQVELMVKNARRYKDTDGWGWGRWRGLTLKPYGGNTHFVDECTGCHMPVHGNDYVYTLPITRVHSDREGIVNNAASSLPESLPWQPLAWRALTMYTDPQTRRTATLYGNDTAVQALERRNIALDGPPGYPSGSVLALVTWAQRDDPHWFGGRIPDTPVAVEFVQTSSGDGADVYRVFEGKALAETKRDTQHAAQRRDLILNLKPASLP